MQCMHSDKQKRKHRTSIKVKKTGLWVHTAPSTTAPTSTELQTSSPVRLRSRRNQDLPNQEHGDLIRENSQVPGSWNQLGKNDAMEFSLIMTTISLDTASCLSSITSWTMSEPELGDLWRSSSDLQWDFKVSLHVLKRKCLPPSWSWLNHKNIQRRDAYYLITRINF